MKFLISILYTFIVCSTNIYSRSIPDLVDIDNRGKFELDAQIKKLEALNELLQQEDTRVIYCYNYEIYDELDEVKKYKFNSIVELFNYYYAQRRAEFTCCY